ncbi:MAG: carbohydrate ABC transporter permease [Clostridiales bacterium]|jgi:putative aldouronate transport system permease protein|nr:carbohydrate ABC transporter permease [Clostridiales bacterium]
MAAKKFSLSQMSFHFVFAAVSLTFLLPLLLIAAVSLTPEKTLQIAGYSFFPDRYVLDAYRFVFRSGSLVLSAYRVTIFVTATGVFAHLLICSMMAYALTRAKLKYANRISLFIYIPLMFSGGLVPYYILITQYLHLKNTVWALIIGGLVSPWNMLVMKNYFRSIPASLVESARIDGAGEFRIYATIALPLATPVIATIGLFTAIGYWNEWMSCALYIEKQELYNLQFLLQSLMSSVAILKANAEKFTGLQKMYEALPSESARMATCVLSIGPIILLYPLLQKYFRKGLILGAIKE